MTYVCVIVYETADLRSSRMVCPHRSRVRMHAPPMPRRRWVHAGAEIHMSMHVAVRYRRLGWLCSVDSARWTPRGALPALRIVSSARRPAACLGVRRGARSACSFSAVHRPPTRHRSLSWDYRASCHPRSRARFLMRYSDFMSSQIASCCRSFWFS